MARLPDPLTTLTPDSRRVYDKITAKRGQMKGGPFASLMHHPALAEKVGDLGEYLRFSSTLPGDIREMAILITARSVNQAYEWVAHARIARTEKLPDDVIERIRTLSVAEERPCSRPRSSSQRCAARCSRGPRSTSTWSSIRRA